VEQIEVFIQGEGSGTEVVVQIAPNAKVRDLAAEAARAGLVTAGDAAARVYLEDGEEVLAPGQTLDKAGIGANAHLHIHRCKKVDVRVNFNGRQVKREFPPSATLRRIKDWATGKQGFDMTDLDASEHALQLCERDARPEDDVHVGTLAEAGSCSVCFDLAAKVRVEGRR
jgi:hypothetical protein